MKKLLLKSVLLILTAISFVACCKCPTGNPQNTITELEAEEMRALFIDNHYGYINEGLSSNFPGAQTDYTHITFELEDLKKYIYEMEQTAKNENYSNLGLRIYLAAALNEENVPNTTLFMRTVGTPDSTDFPVPIRFDTIGQIPQGLVYNKGHVGGNPPL